MQQQLLTAALELHASIEPPEDDCAREPFRGETARNVVVKLREVTKIFRKHWLRDSEEDTLAVDNVNLELATGEIFGLLGLLLFLNTK